MTQRVAKFFKVSYDQFKNDWVNTFYGLVEHIAPEEVENHVREIYDNIKLPARATAKSAGYDFYSPMSFSLYSSEDILIPTGIKCNMPDDMVLMMFPRSGLGSKFMFVPCNLTGIIDADYAGADNEGHIFMKMINNGKKDVRIENGQAFCQGILLNYFTTEDNVDVRRSGGFGSSDI